MNVNGKSASERRMIDQPIQIDSKAFQSSSYLFHHTRAEQVEINCLIFEVKWKIFIYIGGKIANFDKSLG